MLRSGAPFFEGRAGLLFFWFLRPACNRENRLYDEQAVFKSMSGICRMGFYYRAARAAIPLLAAAARAAFGLRAAFDLQAAVAEVGSDRLETPPDVLSKHFADC